MLDPILNLRIGGMDRRRLFKEVGRASEARWSGSLMSHDVFQYDVWLARIGDKLISIGMRLKARTDERYFDSGLNVA